MKYRIGAISLLVIGGLLSAGMLIPNVWEKKVPFRFGLDLVGGTELIYRADVSLVPSGDVGDAMATLRDVIEERVNIFGVSEPIIQVEEAGLVSGNKDHRLIVELPGVSDLEEAKALIGKTPQLEFRIEKPGLNELPEEALATLSPEDAFIKTPVTGRLLKRSTLQFDPQTNQPVVALEFNDEGKAEFAKLTRENIGKRLAIFLDGNLEQSPVITTEIDNGQAIITGYDAVTAREVVRQLNFGALPVPIELVSSQTIGASLGEAALDAGIRAGIWGFGLTALFLILWYRLPGVIATLALALYVVLSLTLFRIIPVTLTAAGVAGFILSIGMAVDANILIFERMKEELKKGTTLRIAMEEGFRRAWLSIRDSNVSSIITAVVLFWLGTSSVKGFALTLGVGVAVSMFTAITATRTFLFAIRPKHENSLSQFLFGVGVSNSTKN